MNCGICQTEIDIELTVISCPSCLTNYHIEHVVQWTNNDYQCVECHNDLRSKIREVTIILELHSNTISIGFAGEQKPRAQMPFQVGYSKYISCFGFSEDSIDLYSKMDRFYIGEEIKNFRQILKVIELNEKELVVQQHVFLQIIHYLFYEVLKVDPMNHAIVIANSVLTNKKQRDLIEDLFFDIFGVPKLFMSSHQFFAVLGFNDIENATNSAYTVEIDNDMIIIMIIINGKINFNSVRMEFIDASVMKKEKDELRSQAKNLKLRSRIVKVFQDSLTQLDISQLQAVKTVFLFDEQHLIINSQRMMDSLHQVLVKHGITNNLNLIQSEKADLSWIGINHLIEWDMQKYDWKINKLYLEASKSHIKEKLSEETEEELKAKAKQIHRDRTSKDKKFEYLSIDVRDIAALPYIPKARRIEIRLQQPDHTGWFMELDRFSENKRYSLKPQHNRGNSHPFSKLEYYMLIKLKGSPYFDTSGLEIYATPSWAQDEKE